MTNKTRLISGRVVTSNSANVPSDRYQHLDLSSAEPNLGTANVGDVLTYNTAYPGSRKWIPQTTVVNTLGQQAFDKANGAYDTANTKLNSTGGIISGSLTITGDLSILGNTTTINTTQLDIKDSLIYLANNNFTSDIVDIGIIGHYANASIGNAHTGIFRDPTRKDWIFFEGYTPEVQANNLIDITHPSFAYANVWANTFKGNLISATASVNGRELYAYTAAGYFEANGAFIKANAAYNAANASFLGVNTAITIIQGVDATQNTNLAATDNKMQFAYGQANTGTVLAQAAYNQANASFLAVNSAITIIQGTDVTQNAATAATNQYATSAFSTANNAYTKANNALANTTGTFAGTLTVTGNVIANSFQTSGSSGNISGANFVYANTFVSSNAYIFSDGTVQTTGAASASLTSSAYSQANTGTVLAQASYNQANASFLGVNTAITIIQGTDVGQNARMTIIEGTNASQNVRLDYSNSAIAIIQGTDVTQNTNIAATDGKMSSAYNQANTGTVLAQASYNQSNASFLGVNTAITIIQGVDVTQNTNIASTDGKMQNAYLQANTGTVLAQASYNQSNASFLAVNSAIIIIQGTDVGQNSRMTIIEGTDVTQNTRLTVIEGTNLSQNSRIDYSNTAITIIQGVDVTQNTNIASTDGKMSSAYNQANTGTVLAQASYNQSNASFLGVNTAITIIQGVDVAQNTRLTVIEGTNASQNVRLDYSNSAITIIQGTDVGQNNRMVIIEGTNASQNVRLDYSNSAIAIIQGVDLGQNTAISSTDGKMSSAYNQANTGTVLAQAAYNQANVTIGVDASQNARMTIIEGTDATQNTNISNKVNLTGSLNQTISGNVTIGQDLVISGNLIITGNVNTQNVQQLAVADPMIILGIGNYVSDTKDIGFAAHYNDGTNAHAGLIRDAGTKEFYVFKGYTPEVDATNNIDINDASFTKANLNASYVKSNLIGTSAVVNGIDLSTYTQATYAQANVTVGVDTSQNARMVIIEGTNASQNTRIDYSNTAITIIQGVDTSQNSRMVIIEGTDTSQNTRIDYSNSAITIIQGTDVSQNSRMTIIEGTNASQNVRLDYSNTAISSTDGKMSSAYNQANTGTVLAQASYNQANVTIGVDATQNTRLTVIENTDVSQNTRLDYSNSAITIIQGVDVTQNTNIASTDGKMSSAYNQANTGTVLAQGAFNQSNASFLGVNTAITIVQGVDVGQNSRMTIIEGTNASQNVRIDYSNSAITIIQGTDVSQNSRMVIIEGTNASQNVRLDYSNSAITIIQGVDVTQNTAIAATDGKMQSAYNTANTGLVLAQAAYNQANVTIGVDTYQNNAIIALQSSLITINSNSAYSTSIDVSQNVRIDYSNTAIAIIQGTDVSQNTRIDYSNTAITIIQGVDATQNTNIAATDGKMQSSYNQANTGTVLAQAAYNQANVTIGVDTTQNSRMTIIEGTDVGQNSRMTIIEGTDVGQNSRMTIIEGTNASQNVRIDYSNSAITIIQGTDVSQNTRIDYSNSAITIIQGVDVTQNTNIAATDGKMQSSYNQANTAQVRAQAAFDTANTAGAGVATDSYARQTANASFSQANTGTVLAQASYNQSNASFLGVNTAITIVQGVDLGQNSRMVIIEGTNASQNVRIDYSNSAITIVQGVDTSQNSRMTIIEGTDVSQNSRMVIIEGTDVSQNSRMVIIEGTNASQNVRIDYSNSAITIIQGVDATQNTNISNKVNLTGSLNQTVSGNVTIGQDLIVSGNLIITGNVNTQNVQQLAVADPMILLGLGNYVSDTKDIGFAAHYNDGTNAHAGIIRDSGTKEFYVFKGYTPEVDATNNIDINAASFAKANLNANYFKGNLIATTADVSGAVTAANYTGAGTGLTGTASGLSIGGTAATATSLTGFVNSNQSNPIAGPNALTTNGIGYVTTISLFGQVDGALYGQAYSSIWQHQIFGDYRTGQIAIRGQNSGTWQAWRTVLDSTNYTSYAPTLTGTGASGTWGIAISGNAATVTNGFYTTSSFNLGTTSIAVNRASATQSLTGINIDGTAGSETLATVTSRGATATASLTIGTGGTYAAGSIYSDSNWGMLFRAKQASPATTQFRWSDSADTELMRLATGGTLTIPGTLYAASKSFLIPHPTKEGKKLRYGSLEGPENGVYIRGKLTNNNTIELPEYWTKLVDPNSITVQLTPIGKHQKLFVENIMNNTVVVANENLLNKNINCFYVIFAERIDVEKLQVEVE